MLSTCLFAVIDVIPWRHTSTFSYMFNPDILFPLSVVLVQATVLAVDLWSVGRTPERNLRRQSEEIRADGGGGKLCDVLLDVEEK